MWERQLEAFIGGPRSIQNIHQLFENREQDFRAVNASEICTYVTLLAYCKKSHIITFECDKNVFVPYPHSVLSIKWYAENEYWRHRRLRVYSQRRTQNYGC